MPNTKLCEGLNETPCPIAAIMVHVPDWRAGLAWYLKAFPMGRVIELPELGWSYLELDGVAIELVKADAKVPPGAAGTVTYWHADDFDSRLRHLESIGAVLYRGPLDIAGGQRMCQVKDPFGNLLGIRGPSKK